MDRHPYLETKQLVTEIRHGHHQEHSHDPSRDMHRFTTPNVLHIYTLRRKQTLQLLPPTLLAIEDPILLRILK